MRIPRSKGCFTQGPLDTTVLRSLLSSCKLLAKRYFQKLPSCHPLNCLQCLQILRLSIRTTLEYETMIIGIRELRPHIGDLES